MGNNYHEKMDLLLRQLEENTISKEGLYELMELLQKEENKPFVKEWLYYEISHQQNENVDEDKLNSILQSILKQKKNKPLAKIYHWFPKAVAAAVLLFAVGTTMFIYHWKLKNSQYTQIQNKSSHKILPGTNKAILTLADGSTIALDSTINGVLAKQGNSNILKLSNGKIAYTQTNRENKTVLYNTVTTPRGGEFQIVLPDGTKIWLNAATTLTYPTSFSGKDRKVRLQGEAYFEVAKDTSKPFIVNVINREEVEVLGTHFNINSYPNEENIKTTLLEGKVKMSRANESKNNNYFQILAPGEQSVLSNSNEFALVKDVMVDDVIAWKNGMTSFKSAGLQAIMRQIERWYDIDVVFEGDVSDRKFSGDISRNAGLEDVLKIFEASGIHFTIKGKTLMVNP